MCMFWVDLLLQYISFTDRLMKRRRGRVQSHHTVLRVPPFRPRHPLTEAEPWPESLQAPPLPQAPPPAWGGPGKGHNQFLW